MGDLEPARHATQRGPLGPTHVRVGDPERLRIVDELQRHYVLGRLTQDELDQRVSRSLAARTFGDLEDVVNDLPFEPPPAASESSAASSKSPRDIGDLHAGSRHLGQAGHMEPLWHTTDFRAHALSYGLVMALLVAIWLITSPGGYFWPIWPMLGWGFGLAAHGLSRKERMRSRARRGERE